MSRLIFSTLTRFNPRLVNRCTFSFNNQFTSFIQIKTTRYFSADTTSTAAAASSNAGEALSRDEVTSRVLEVIKKFPLVDSAKVSATSNFNSDLGLDSLDTVELVMAIEDEFGLVIPDHDSDKILSAPDAINYIVTHAKASK
jgi:NADH dehydrogenase (ubiquinone) 1 alpha/beta subcomplex 1